MQQLVEVNRRDRYLFIGTFKCYTITRGSRGYAQHIIIENVTDIYGNKIADYIRFANIKTFLKLQLNAGDKVSFYARFVDFAKLYSDCRYGYNDIYPRLLNPSRATKLISPVKRMEEYHHSPIYIKGVI